MAHCTHCNIVHLFRKIGSPVLPMCSYSSPRTRLSALSTASTPTTLKNLNPLNADPLETTGCREERICFLGSNAIRNQTTTALCTRSTRSSARRHLKPNKLRSTPSTWTPTNPFSTWKNRQDWLRLNLSTNTKRTTSKQSLTILTETNGNLTLLSRASYVTSKDTPLTTVLSLTTYHT